MPAVKVSHVFKSFTEKTAVDDLSFSVERGEILGLIGPNGAGKTTTIRMVMDIIRPDAGEISILGENLWFMSLFLAFPQNPVMNEQKEGKRHDT